MFFDIVQIILSFINSNFYIIVLWYCTNFFLLYKLRILLLMLLHYKMFQCVYTYFNMILYAQVHIGPRSGFAFSSSSPKACMSTGGRCERTWNSGWDILLDHNSKYLLKQNLKINKFKKFITFLEQCLHTKNLLREKDSANKHFLEVREIIT